MGNVVPIGQRKQLAKLIATDIIDTSNATMENLKLVRLEQAINLIEFEASRIASLFGEVRAIEIINDRVIKRLAEKLQP